MATEGIPIQLTADKGTETGLMQSIQIALRYATSFEPIVEGTFKADPYSGNFAPELDPIQFPPFMALKSVHNTTIEGFWRWLREKIGHDVKVHLLRGHGHHYNVMVPWHK